MRDIVICVDGTWCGPQTVTRTNTYLLACTFAGKCINEPNETYGGYSAPNGDVHVLYYPGTGVDNGDFAGYLVNGALALDIRARCSKAYRFIVDHFQPEKEDALGNIQRSRIWLFGHSRGAHIVRSVAGMIRNCGIIDKSKKPPETDLDLVAGEVYSLYRSRDPENHPNTTTMTAFRAQHSLPRGSKPPVFFMGLLDTVGALGVPQVNQGASGVEYELYDCYVSSDVQHVWQGLAAHDRLTVFTPTFALSRYAPADRSSTQKDSPAPSTTKYDVEYTCEEIWFPGAHYDIGRQKLVFLRMVQGRWLEWVLEVLNTVVNPLHLNVSFTRDLANAPLKALAHAVRDKWAKDKEGLSSCSSSSILPDPDTEDMGGYLKWDTPSTPFQGFVERLTPWAAYYTMNAYDEIFENSPLLKLPVVGALVKTFMPIALNDRLVPLGREAQFCGDANAFKHYKGVYFKSKSYDAYQILQLPKAPKAA